ncbi:MAG: cysteine peptidase family C39 domain-containing protein [Verrucomicrobiota bacterium]
MTHLPAPMVPDGYVWEGDGVIPMQGWCQMDSYSCGPVAAFMMLSCFFPGKTFARLVELCAVGEDGSSGSNIRNALRHYGLRCRITRSLNKRVVDAAIAAGSPILVGVAGEFINCADDHWMVVHGSRSGGVLLAGHLELGRSSRWVPWARLNKHLAPEGWGMVVSR